MSKINGFSICLGVFLLAFTIVYFVVANKISYNFEIDYEKDLYEVKVKSIEEQATLYVRNNEELMDEKKPYITVDDLAKLGYVISNDGVVEDPRDNEKNLNDKRIKLTYDEDKVAAKFLG